MSGKTILPLVLSLCAIVQAQTVYLAGDSTMASGGGGSGTDGEYRWPLEVINCV